MNVFTRINRFFFPGAADYPPNGVGKTVVLGLQHAFAMSCATILVPILTGMDVGVALLMAGVGTLIFHLCTGGRMPTFLGSSFAFIPALIAVIGVADDPDQVPMFGTPEKSLPYALGGIVVAGGIYLVIALLIKLFGKGFISKLFPPVVRGVGIAIIGLNLAGAAIDNIQANGIVLYTPAYYWSWGIAGAVCLTAVVLSSYGRGMVKMASIFISLAGGYILTLILVKTGAAPESLMNLAAIGNHGIVEAPGVVFPKFDLSAILVIAPIAIVTCVEHVGDVYANSSVVGRDFTEKPGLHRTMLGDGLATAVAGCFGGPANTTYSENTAVLAATGNYNPASIRLAAVIAIIVSFFGKAIGVVETIPNCVLGGACIVLYGMIASVGLRTLVENKVDFTKNRNLCIAAVMLVLAIGGAVIGGEKFGLSGIGLGIIVGIILNLVLPSANEEDTGFVTPSEDEAPAGE